MNTNKWTFKSFASNGWIEISLLLAVTSVLYFPISHYPFITYDDPKVVTENPQVLGGLTSDGFKWAWTTGYFSNWTPLTWLSLMLDIELYGLESGGFHLTNLLIHLATITVVYATFRRLSENNFIALLVAILFALHPLHVQSLSWVSERKGLLSTFFWFLTVFTYLLYVENKAIWRYGVTSLIFVCSLLCKQMAVTLPIVLLVLDWYPLKRWDKSGLGLRTTIVEKIPLFAIATTFSLIAYLAQEQGGALLENSRIDFSIRVANAFASYGIYLRRLFIPTDLSFHYHNYGAYPTTLEFVWIVLFISVGCVCCLKGRQLVAAGAMWYVISFLPVIGLIQVGQQRMADRYADIPMVGMYWIMAYWAFRVRLPLVSRTRYLRLAPIALAIPLIFVSNRQIAYWQDSRTLYERALELDPANPVAHLNLGVIEDQQGNSNIALGHFERTLAVDPMNIRAMCNLGKVAHDLGDAGKSRAMFVKAVSLSPTFPEANIGLATAYASEEKLSEALALLDAMKKLHPEHQVVLFNRASILARLGQLREALEQYTELIAKGASTPQLYFWTGETAAKLGHWSMACKHYRQAGLAGLHAPELNSGYVRSLVRAGRDQEASEVVERILRSEPRSIESRRLLAYAVCSSALYPGALAPTVGELIDSVVIDYDATSKWETLVTAWVFLRKGLYDDAIEAAKKAEGLSTRSLDPGFCDEIMRLLEAIHAVHSPP